MHKLRNFCCYYYNFERYDDVLVILWREILFRFVCTVRGGIAH